MTKEYINRYGDRIWFKEIDEHTIEVTGYLENYLRIGCSNDWSEAYEIYCMGKQNPMSYVQFVHDIEENMYKSKHELHPYVKYCKTDMDHLNMVDPSGGPYITLGTNVGTYFNDNKERRVQSIELGKHKFTLFIQ